MGAVALSGCGDRPLDVPVKDHPSHHHFSAAEWTVDVVERHGDSICAFSQHSDGRVQLLVFEPGAVGATDPLRVEIDGVSLEAGTAFRAGPIQEIPGGFRCEGTLYDAVHVIGEVTLEW